MEGLPQSEVTSECKATLSPEQLQQARLFMQDLFAGRGGDDLLYIPGDDEINQMYAGLSEEERVDVQRDFARGYEATVADAQQRLMHS